MNRVRSAWTPYVVGVATLVTVAVMLAFEGQDGGRATRYAGALVLLIIGAWLFVSERRIR